MTGEITLRGRVLPIGGLKEKMIAALRGGVDTILIPKENEKDLVEIPDQREAQPDDRPRRPHGRGAGCGAGVVRSGAISCARANHEIEGIHEVARSRPDSVEVPAAAGSELDSRVSGA